MMDDNASPSTSRGAGIIEAFEMSSPTHTRVEDLTSSVKEVGTEKGKHPYERSDDSFHNGGEQPRKPQTASDRDRLDAGRQALRELLKERKQKKQKRTSCASLLKLYLTILSALLIIGGLLVLLFLFPMTIDPALATLNYDIEDNPAICLTLFTFEIKRSSNASSFWCSCTEGCTKDLFFCDQITVAYRKSFLSLDSHLQGGFNQTAYYSMTGLKKPSLVDEIDDSVLSKPMNSDCKDINWVHNPECWDSMNASLYVNVKGCGYPPEVNCEKFIESYNKTGRRFLCYFSKLDPSIVITNYNPDEPWESLTLSLGWTLGAQAIGSFVIFLLHCPFKAACKAVVEKTRFTKRAAGHNH